MYLCYNIKSVMKLTGPVWLMQPIPYFGEKINFDDWVWEVKIDGWRLQIIKFYTGKIEFYGRRLETNPRWTEKLCYLIDTVDKVLPEYTLIDCELYSDKGRRFIPSLFTKNPKVKPIIYVFDVIFFKEKFVGNLELFKRREILEKFNFQPPLYLIKQNKIVHLKTALELSLKDGNEGIVIKNIYSEYRISSEGPVATEFWRKIKG